MSKHKKDPEKQFEYATIILAKVSELFDEHSESDYKISLEEIQKGDNMTHFIHALANIVPCRVYEKFTGDELNILKFNHVANQLVFQYSKKAD